MSDLIIRSGKIYPAPMANGATASDVIEAKGHCMYGLVVPSTLDGTALTFEVSADGSTFQALYDSLGVAVGITIAASRSYDLPTALAPWPFWRLKMGTSQTGATAFVVVGKG